MTEPFPNNQNLVEENALLARRVQVLEDADTASRLHDKARRLARFTIEAASDALEWIAIDGRIVDVNEAACRLLGYTRSELLQLKIPDIDPHYDADVWPGHFDDLRERGSIRLETEQRAKDGRLVPVEVVANYVRHGDVELNCAFLRDITERKQLEAELRENETTFRSVLETSSDAVLLQDSTAAFIDCNQAALDLLKMTREQFINMTPDQISVEFQPNGRRSEEYAPEMTALGRKGFHRFEWTCKNLLGDEFVVEVSLVPFLRKGEEMLHCTWRDITERKRIESELRESDETLRTILETTLDGYWQVDAGGRLTDVNSTYCQQSGYTREELLSMSIPDLEATESAAETAEHIRAIFETGRDQFESRHRRKDGTIWDVEISVTARGDGLCCFYRDISERKSGEVALKTSEQRFRDIADISADWIWEVDAQGVYTYASESVLALLGYEPDELIGKTPFDFMPAEEAQRVGADFGGIIAAQAPFRDLYNVVLGKDGSPHDCLTSGTPILDADGTLLGYRGVDRDITERKAAELELRENERTFRNLLETSSDAVLLQDSTAAFIDCNQAALDLLKMTREQFINMTPDQISVEFQPNGRRSEEYAPEMTALGRQGFHRFEWTCKNLPGDEFVVEVSLVPFLRKGEEMLHCTWRDITERITRQRQEAEAKRLSDSLDEINALLSSTMHLDRMLGEVCAMAVEATGASSVALLRRAGGSWAVMSHSGPITGLKGALQDDEVSCSLVDAVRIGDPVTIINGCSQDHDCSAISRGLAGVVSLVAPVGDPSSTEAALIIGRQAEDPGFSDPQTDFTRKLAVSLSMSIEKERLYTQQQRVADTLQDGFLSMPSEVPGLDIGHLYHASDDVARVGGDFYDLFEMGEGRAGIILGDVSGHGLWVATFTAMVRSSIRAYMLDGASPAQAMQKTNRMLIARKHDDIFVTVWCGLLDRGSGYLQYCSAGHPPAVIKRKSGEVTTLPGRSMMLGALSDAHYREHQSLLEVGDALLLYTDGVTEARSSRDSGRCLFGEKRLVTLIEGMEARVPVDDVPPAILRTILGYAEDGLVDDVAILALARNGGAAS